MDNWVTIAGNVVAEPVKRLTKDGIVVGSFRLASTPRRLDRAAGEYKDGETLFVGVTCWRALAENVADSLHRGDAVVVHGRMRVRSFVGSDGQVRSVTEVDAATAGPDLCRGTAQFRRRGRTHDGPPPGAEDASPSHPHPVGADDELAPVPEEAPAPPDEEVAEPAA